MFRLGLPLLVIVIGVVVGVSFSRGRSSAHRDRPGPIDATVSTTSPAAPPVGLDTSPAAAPRPAEDGSAAAWLERWVAAGLVTPDQSQSILDFERGSATVTAPLPAAPARRVPLLAEALGYLGGMLGIIGITVWVAGFWRDIAGGTRLGVSAGVTAVLVAIGFVVKADEPALARLRGFVWLAGSAAAGVVGSVIANDMLDTTSGESIAIGAALGVLVVSGGLWMGRSRPAQQFSSLAALEVVAAVIAWQASGSVAAGFTELVVAGCVLALGVRRMTPAPWIATLVGTAGVLVGASLPVERWHEPGSLVAIVAGIAVVSLAELPALRLSRGERIAMLVFAVISFLFNVPSTLGYFANDGGLATGLVVWAVGGAVVGAAVTRRIVHPVTLEVAGGVLLVGGAALTGVQHEGFATVFGLATALAMLALGTRPGRVLMSVTGSLGLLVNVPWAISYFFPGENLAPLLVAVSGVLLVVIAVVLTRMGGRFRRELQR